ncbi:MAG: hypothetical protein ACYS22_16755 [Planctomycetota bacterium]|jgi:hypothetical protein
MSQYSRLVLPLSLCLVVALALLSAGPLAAQAAQANVVQISIVNKVIKVTNRGVGLCKTAEKADDCPDVIVWKWIGAPASSEQGASPNLEETEETKKIVISYIKGTNEAYNCFKEGLSPKLSFEIRAPNTQVEATVDDACPAKSAWLYQISCVRTDAGHEGELCEGIAPVDPGAVIG